MKKLAVGLLVAASAFAELTPAQRELDFSFLAAYYNRNYAPYEWKRQAIGVDMLALRPWLERVARANDDLEFYEICSEYVNSLFGGHDTFVVPSDFNAWLGFTVDLAEGKALVDQIDRTVLSTSEFPAEVGDELLALDGKAPAEWIWLLSRFMSYGSIEATHRLAGASITDLWQELIPRAPDIGETAVVEIRRASGEVQRFTLKWIKSGTPLRSAGTLPLPRTPAEARGALEKLQYAYSGRAVGLRGIAATEPVFTVRPPGWTQRLGRSSADFVFSGTFQVNGRSMGFIRIPHFVTGGPAGELAALRQVDREIAFFEENTEGLVIDIMRNPGGDICYMQNVLRRLIPYGFRTVGFEIRATAEWISELSDELETARSIRAPEWQIAAIENILGQMQSAYREMRGRTGPLPVCGISLDLNPVPVAYTKPVVLLVDAFTTSAAEAFAAVLQDSLRVTVFGTRTTGAGGTATWFEATRYSEAAALITVTLMHRPRTVFTSDYPATNYIENVGVRPDAWVDYMTRDNLITGGRAFVDAWVDVLADVAGAR
jgi:hypothetical protein